MNNFPGTHLDFHPKTRDIGLLTRHNRLTALKKKSDPLCPVCQEKLETIRFTSWEDLLPQWKGEGITSDFLIPDHVS